MSPLFGMAGPAEAVEAITRMVGYSGLLLLALAAAIALFARSRFAAGVALAVAFFVTLLFMPWQAFRPYQSDDPDVDYWVAAWRSFGWWWGITVAATLAATVRVFGRMASVQFPTEFRAWLMAAVGLFIALGFVDPAAAVAKWDKSLWAGVARFVAGNYFCDTEDIVLPILFRSALQTVPALALGWMLQAVVLVARSRGRAVESAEQSGGAEEPETRKKGTS